MNDPHARDVRRLFMWALFATLACVAYIHLRNDGSDHIFWRLLHEQDTAAAWLLLGILFVSWWSRKNMSGLAGVVGWIGDHPRHIIGGFTVLLAVAARFIYHAHPLSMDEYAAWFQSEVFAEGRLTGQFPVALMDRLIEPQFQNYFLVVNRETGQVASAYWPGFSLMMAPFSALGVPWLCNPVLSGLSLLLLWQLAGTLFGDKQSQGWVLLFTCASPAFLVNGMSFYSMPAHLLLNLVFVWLVLRGGTSGYLLAGMTGGWALSLHQPIPHLLFAFPWLVWLVWRRPGGWSSVFWIFSGYLIVGFVLVLGWFYWLHNVLAPFGTLALEHGMAPVAESGVRDFLSTVVDIVRSLLHVPNAWILDIRLAGLVKLWLWSVPFLLVLAIRGLSCRAAIPLRLLGWSAMITFFGYFLIPFDQGHGWGYRYFHSAFGVLPLLAVAGLKTFKGDGVHGDGMERLVAVAAALSLFVANGLHVWQVEDFMAAHLAQLPPSATGRTLMFQNGIGYYARDLIQNDPWLRGSVIMIGRVSSADAAIMSRYYPQAEFVGRNQYGRTYRLAP